jgi:hypothetical protein
MLRLVVAALLVAALVAVALAVALRGPDAHAVRAREGRVTITLRDFRLHPQVVRARTGRLIISLHNAGRLGHAFRVRKEGRIWVQEPTLLPGERRSVTVRLERGDYRSYDPLQNFEALGMYGTLVVR